MCEHQKQEREDGRKRIKIVLKIPSNLMSFFPHLMVLRMDAEIKLHELLLLFHYSLNLYEAFSVLSQEGGENNKSAQSTNSEQN